MKKNQIIFILLLVLGYLIWHYLYLASLRKDRSVFLSDLNMTIVDINKSLSVDLEKFSSADYLLWDMKESKLLKDREAKKIAKKESKKESKDRAEKSINLKNRTICLEKVCWEFLGVVTSNGETVVTLLSTEPKAKLETFYKNDMLLENLKIVEIKGDQLLLENQKDQKEFTLKLFDVDGSKYIPKNRIKGENE